MSFVSWRCHVPDFGTFFRRKNYRRFWVETNGNNLILFFLILEFFLLKPYSKAVAFVLCTKYFLAFQLTVRHTAVLSELSQKALKPPVLQTFHVIETVTWSAIVAVIPIDISIYRSCVCALFKLNVLSMCGYQLGEVPNVIWNDRDYIKVTVAFAEHWSVANYAHYPFNRETSHW